MCRAFWSGCEGVVNVVMNLWVPQNARKFLSSCATGDLPRRNQFQQGYRNFSQLSLSSWLVGCQEGDVTIAYAHFINDCFIVTVVNCLYQLNPWKQWFSMEFARRGYSKDQWRGPAGAVNFRPILL
jgi:hypothetical protein